MSSPIGPPHELGEGGVGLDGLTNRPPFMGWRRGGGGLDELTNRPP